MGWRQEVKEWENNLFEENSELDYLKIRISDHFGITKKIVTRLFTVIDVLKKNIHSLIEKCGLLRDSNKNQIKILETKKEYFQVMENVDDLYNTVDVSNLKPRYVLSTYNSRKRRLSKENFENCEEKVNQRPFSATSRKDDRKIDKNDLISLKKILKKFTEKIENHRHFAYEKKIFALEEDFLNSKKMIEKMKEKTNENLKVLHELSKRVKTIEKKRNKDE